MKFSASISGAHQQRAGCAVVGVFDGRRLSDAATSIDEAGGGRIKRLLRTSSLTGRAGQTLLIHDPPGVPASTVLLVGCGKGPAVSATRFQRVARSAMRALVANAVRDASVYLTEVQVDERDGAWRLRQCVEACHKSIYRFDQLKSANHERARVMLRSVRLERPPRMRADAASNAIVEGNAIGNGVRLAKDLGNLPGNICTPTYLADRARKLARSHPTLKVSVRGESDMKRLAMGALLSVSQGSREPAKLICIEHRGGPRGERPAVFVGKGVTFDSGGISIKPSATMDEMKFDMCGAASVMGLLSTVSEIGLPQNVVGIIPATENLPGGSATKPGDIVTTMSGRTVEILNTDAEGRLILCDALSFAERFKPDVVVDIATLTGACVIALGSQASGLFSNHAPLASALLAAGEQAGDRAWELPLWSEYREQLRSNFADLANIGGRKAGAITAASFLSRFAEDYRWAHLDIAGTAWLSGSDKGATGRPVALLVQYLLDRGKRRRRRSG